MDKIPCEWHKIMKYVQKSGLTQLEIILLQIQNLSIIYSAIKSSGTPASTSIFLIGS